MTYYDNEKNLPVAYSDAEEDYKDITENEEREKDEDITESSEVYDLPTLRSDRSRLWSLISVILAVMSIALSPIAYYVALPFAVASLGFALISRKRIEFFTPMTLVGLFGSMIGIVAGLSFMAVAVFNLF